MMTRIQSLYIYSMQNNFLFSIQSITKYAKKTSIISQLKIVPSRVLKALAAVGTLILCLMDRKTKQWL